MPLNPNTGLEDPNWNAQPSTLPADPPSYQRPLEQPESLEPPDAAIGAPNPDVAYTNYGTVKTEAQLAEDGDPADYGPAGMPAASADDAPFSEEVVPAGWSRFPTSEEVAYLNNKYPTTPTQAIFEGRSK